MWGESGEMAPRGYRVDSLSLTINRLTELCNLHLQHNRIRCIGMLMICLLHGYSPLSSHFHSSAGKGLTGLRKLHVLRLDHNRLEQVAPGEMASLAGLVQLDLSYNQLTVVESLGCLANLEELRLASNHLQELPNVSRCKKVPRPHPLPVTVALTCCSHCAVAGARHLLQPCACAFSQQPGELAATKGTSALQNIWHKDLVGQVHLQILRIESLHITDVASLPVLR